MGYDDDTEMNHGAAVDTNGEKEATIAKRRMNLVSICGTDPFPSEENVGNMVCVLLGRKVVIYKPISTRFYGLKPAVQFCAEHNWPDKILKAERPPPDYLNECRAFNSAFFQQVCSMLLR